MTTLSPGNHGEQGKQALSAGGGQRYGNLAEWFSVRLLGLPARTHPLISSSLWANTSSALVPVAHQSLLWQRTERPEAL